MKVLKRVKRYVIVSLSEPIRFPITFIAIFTLFFHIPDIQTVIYPFDEFP